MSITLELRLTTFGCFKENELLVQSFLYPEHIVAIF